LSGKGGGLRGDRQREQRKRIIKMCVQKLRDIDDPETVLCRAVLINNTFRTLKTAQRAIMRNARRRVLERKESSEEEEEEEEEKGEKEKGEEDEEISITSPPSEPLPSLRQDSRPNFSESELSDLSCDIGCSDSSMVHSLVMPPLLSPHIEDMTNCSFYDSFGPVDLGVNNQQTDEQNNQDQESNVPTNLKLTMMKSDLCDVISETNSNSGANGFSFPKSDFGSCGGPSEAPDMFDTLLTEISQA